MTRLDRLTAILLLLQEKPRTSRELAEHFEVSKRTIIRDVEGLCEMGIPVIAREGARGGYELPPEFDVQPLPLTAREAFILLLALGGLENMSNTSYSVETTTLRAKLQNLIPARRKSQAEDLSRIARLAIPKRDAQNPHLETLLEAARTRTWLAISYNGSGGKTHHTIQPIRLYSAGGYWYCEAYSHERGANRNFRIDRVEQVEPAFTPEGAAPRERELPYDDPSHPEVVIELTRRGVMMVESEQHLGNGVERNQDGSGSLQFRCPPSEIRWFARYFIPFGDDATVLGPPVLVDELLAAAKIILEKYGNGE